MGLADHLTRLIHYLYQHIPTQTLVTVGAALDGAGHNQSTFFLPGTNGGETDARGHVSAQLDGGTPIESGLIVRTTDAGQHDQ
ncbi:MAG TPA: hypothetical protein PLT93_02190 [Phycisphaerae bacterium]|nr:hypothetical protein [Phycisphaerae bacterium]